MAAHILTVLKQIQSGKANMPQVIQGMSYALFGDNLEDMHWMALNEYCEEEETFVNTALELLPYYEKKWERLGKPATAEEWLKAEYPWRATVRQPSDIAADTIAYYRNLVGTDEDGATLSDLLADLMHYCDVNALDFDERLHQAQARFQEETAPDLVVVPIDAVNEYFHGESIDELEE